MPTTNVTAFADWPRHLQESWQDYAQRGEVDADNPPTSILEAYLQVAEARTKRLASIPWGDVSCDDHADGVEDEVIGAEYGRKLAFCAECGTKHLEHFYTSKRDGRMLCGTCFQRRVVQGVARKPASADS